MTLTEYAPAKINLALHVRERLPNGYHILDTIFAFIADGDMLTAIAGNGCSMDIAGPFSKGLPVNDDNLVLEAAKALAKAAHIDADVHFTLTKNLPIASGIGGGSADAAAALRLCNTLWGLDWPLEKLCKIGLPLGADVPVCIASSSCHGTGIGEQLVPINAAQWQNMPILLVNPLKPVSTGQIFGQWDKQDKGAFEGPINELASVANGRNDLQPMAISLCPEIALILEQLSQTDPTCARMSGSGATCFAIFAEDEACIRAEEQIKSVFPDYWTLTSRLRDWDFGRER